MKDTKKEESLTIELFIRNKGFHVRWKVSGIDHFIQAEISFGNMEGPLIRAKQMSSHPVSGVLISVFIYYLIYLTESLILLILLLKLTIFIKSVSVNF